MSVLSIFITFIIFVTAYFKEKKYYHPVVSFSFLYFLIMFMSSLKLYGFNSSGDTSYVLFTIGVLFFTLGSLCMKKVRFQTLNNVEYKFVERRYLIMVCICLVLVMIRFTVILKFFLSGGTIGDVYVTMAGATESYDGELAQSKLQNLIMQFITLPFLNVIVPTSLVLFFTTLKKKYLFISIILSTMLVLLDSRRTYLISCILFVVIGLSFFYFNEKKTVDKEKLKKQLKKWGGLVVLLFFFLFVFITKQRFSTLNQTEGSVFHTFYAYYAGTVQYFEFMIKEHTFEYTYFFSTLRGLFSPIFGILNIFDIDSPYSYQIATDIVNNMKHHVLYVSPTDRFNSFTTCFYQFYCDGGIIGIIVMSFMFGAYSQYLYNNLILGKGIRFKVKYMYYYGVILMLSFTNMRTILMYITWTLILERFLYKKIVSKNYC